MSSEQEKKGLSSQPQETRLNTTVSSFANRMKRALQEQSSQQEVVAKESAARHARILQAMNSIRKILQEITRVSLGDRFLLTMEVSDIDGWPAVTIKLIDSLCPGDQILSLVTSAHDRDCNGVVSIRLNNDKSLGALYMSDPAEVERIPLVLKKIVREFLDLVTESIVNAKRPEDTLEHQTRRIEGDLLEENKEESQILSDDIFDDRGPFNYDNLVKVEK